MNSTSRSPGTEVTVALHQESNGNIEVNLKAEHLPPPERLAPELKTYVVWITPRASEQPYNAGMLRTNASQYGKLQTLTSQTAFFVSITGEERGDVLTPSTYVVAEGQAEWSKDKPKSRLQTTERVLPAEGTPNTTE